jgi:hypothetical protein
MNIDANDHQRFREAIHGGGLRWSTIAKDITPIEGRIKRVAYNFASGIKIVGRPEAVDAHVEVKNLQDRQARVTVVDELKQVRSSG